MKLSVLIPMYNASAYIGNCLDSLLHQDLSTDDYEIIIIDDGSTDHSVEIVEEYKLNMNNIFLHKQENVGLYHTRNRLLKLAKGDYIYNLDADDYLAHYTLNKLLIMAIENNLDVLCFDTKETTALDDVTVSNQWNKIDFLIETGQDFLKNKRHLRLEVWWYFIKRDFLNTINLTFNDNQYNADVLFTLKLFFKAKSVQYIPVSLHRYVQTQDSIMRNDAIISRMKRLVTMRDMVIDFSKFINKIKNQNFVNNREIIDNLTFRRDAFTFFTIIKMIKNRFDLEFFKFEIKKLKEVNAYPIQNFLGPEYNSLCYRTLNFIINKESLILTIVYLKNFPVKMINILSSKKQTIEA